MALWRDPWFKLRGRGRDNFYDAIILTDGPVRNGFLLADFQPFGGEGGNGGSNIFFDIGGDGGEYGTGGCTPSPYDCTPLTFSVTLGVPLDVSLRGSVSSTSSGEEGTFFSANLSGTLSFSFFELDGTTPVGWTDITSAPEPNAAWLCALGIALIGMRIKRKV